MHPNVFPHMRVFIVCIENPYFFFFGSYFCYWCSRCLFRWAQFTFWNLYVYMDEKFYTVIEIMCEWVALKLCAVFIYTYDFILHMPSVKPFAIIIALIHIEMPIILCILCASIAFIAACLLFLECSFEGKMSKYQIVMFRILYMYICVCFDFSLIFVTMFL